MLDAFRDDPATLPCPNRAPTNWSACRVRSSENGFPIGDEIPLGILLSLSWAKRYDGSQPHLEQRIDGFEHVCHALERGGPSRGLLRAKPQDELVAVESVKQQREKGLQIEIPGQEVFATQIHNGLIQLRFARLRSETHGAKAHDLGTTPALNLVYLLAEPCHADISDAGIFRINVRSLWFAAPNATNNG